MNLQFWSVFQKLKELAAVMKVVSKEPCSYGQFSPFLEILLRMAVIYQNRFSAFENSTYEIKEPPS